MNINQQSLDANLKDNNIEAGFLDKRVGGRIRLRRRVLGYSQEKLALALGLSFQQIQKYEKGTNRIGASRLFDIAQILQVPINFFFDELLNPIYIEEDVNHSNMSYAAIAQDADNMSDEEVMNINLSTSKNNSDVMHTQETMDLLKAYYDIQAPEIRQKLLHLIRVMSNTK